jgi:hypothetical protein
VLQHIFDVRDLFLMEYVFEKGINGALWEKVDEAKIDAALDGEDFDGVQFYDFETSMSFDAEEIERAERYGCKYSDDDERLRIIMMNVVRNEGRFVLPQRVEVLQ